MITPQQALIIREAQPKDAVVLATIYLDSALHHFDLDRVLYRVPNRKLVLDQFIRRLHYSDSCRANGVIFVAEIAGVVMGYANATVLPALEESSMIQEISSIDIGLSVAQNSRSHGIGTALMRAIESWAIAQGIARITLNTHISNSDAIRFYQERHGYRPVGLVMEKALKS